ncbi:hypothetical protein F4678DRAFT_333362 [Xylaria arbuscula]|nr:hypothetical protein F4678DRAFT_333362 [Xylaria arbuscula]
MENQTQPPRRLIRSFPNLNENFLHPIQNPWFQDVPQSLNPAISQGLRSISSLELSHPINDSYLPLVPHQTLPPRLASIPPTVPLQGTSVQYQGNHQSALIPPENNTSVWITNLPPTCTYANLLGQLRDIGKICATVINPPQQNHTTSAAKIVFFDVEGKNRLLASASEGSFIVDNLLPCVVPNRILTEARPVGPQSRVLIITGPRDVVNLHYLCQLFERFCAFDLEYVRTVQHVDGTATMDWAFGSYRCQAERVYGEMMRLKCVSPMFAVVEVRWGRDPCDRQ